MAREVTLGCKATSPMVLGNGNKTPSPENRGRTSTTDISHDAKPRIQPQPYPKHVHGGRPGGIHYTSTPSGAPRRGSAAAVSKTESAPVQADHTPPHSARGLTCSALGSRESGS